MLTPKPTGELGPLTVVPRKPEVVLADDSRVPVTLPLPLLEDLLEIEQFEQRHVSLSEGVADALKEKQKFFRWELERMASKEKRLGEFPTFLTRAASLAARAGDYELEAKYLERASSVSNAAFVRHRVVDTMLASGKLSRARKLLNAFDLNVDAAANLKLAMLEVFDSKFEKAAGYIEKAVDLDPTDSSARLFQGGLALFNDQPAFAIRAFRVAAVERGNSSVLHTNLALAHIRLGEVEKAFLSLRRAVALGPLNANAVCILADLAFKHGRNEDAVPSLRYLVRCEQKYAGVWARLARACLQIGKYDEVIDSLKHQAGIESTTSVWNNLGVAYLRLQRREKAIAAFAHAMKKGKDAPDRGFFLAARNTAQFLLNADRLSDFAKLVKATLRMDRDQLCLRDPALTDIYAFQLHLYRVAGDGKKLRELATQLLSTDIALDKIKMWGMGLVAAHGALSNDTKVLDWIENWSDWLESIPSVESIEHTMLFNNVAFAFAELGDTGKAEQFLYRLRHKIRLEAYPTATRGLISIRNGKFQRGERDYEKAIELASGRVHKTRIRQKLDLERGKYWIVDKPSKARRFLDKVIRMQPGEELLVENAQQLLRLLKRGN